MANPSVSLILLEAEWMTLYEADCPPNAPVLITRNLTLRGNAARPTTLNLNFLRHKFRLQNGTMIRLQNTIIHRSRAGPASLAVGMDLFAPTFPGEEAIQWIEDGYTIYPVCFNVETYRTFTTVTAHNPLPPQLPPGNAWELPVPVPSPPGICKNVSDALTPDADPSVYPLDRCYALSVRCLVSSVYGADLQPVSGNAVKNGYLVHLERMINLCPEVLSSECITTRGPLGCAALWHSQNRMTWLDGNIGAGSPPPPALTPGGNDTLGGGQGQGQGQAGAPDSSGGNSAGVPVAAIAGGIAGAVIALAAAAGAVLLARRRRLRQAHNAVEAGSDAKGPAVHTKATGDVEAPTSFESGGSPCNSTTSSGDATHVQTLACPTATDSSSAGVVAATTGSSGRSQAVACSGSSGPGSGPRSAAERVPSPSPGATPTAAAAASAAGKASGKLALPPSAASVAQRARRVATGSGSSSLNSASPAAASAAAGSTLAGPPVSRLTPQRKDLHTDAWLEMSALGQPVNARGDSTAATSARESPTAAAAAGAAKLTDPAAAATDAGVGAVAAAAAVVSDASLNAGDGSTQEQSDNVVRLLPQVLGRGAFGKVYAGVYRGRHVAVKLLMGLGPHQLAPPVLAAGLPAPPGEGTGPQEMAAPAVGTPSAVRASAVALPQHTGSPSADSINPVHIQQRQQVANTNAGTWTVTLAAAAAWLSPVRGGSSATEVVPRLGTQGQGLPAAKQTGSHEADATGTTAGGSATSSTTGEDPCSAQAWVPGTSSAGVCGGGGRNGVQWEAAEQTQQQQAPLSQHHPAPAVMVAGVQNASAQGKAQQREDIEQHSQAGYKEQQQEAVVSEHHSYTTLFGEPAAASRAPDAPVSKAAPAAPDAAATAAASTTAAAAVAPAVWYDPEELELFTREVQVLGRLSHPNIVRLIAVCTAPPRLSLVMEAAETSLDKVVYGGSGAPGGGELLPLPKVLHIAVQIAQGLAYLHPTVCHGDLKPANVLLNGASSDTPEVKLTDFGQAHIRMSTTFGSSRATLGALDAPAGGTAAFCAPECFDQAGGRAVAVTHKADIYSFAVVLWCMLTGQEPWQGLGAVSIAVQVALRGRSLLSVPSGLAEERCPPKLKRLLAECFEPDPRRRPAAAEVVKQLMLVEEQWVRSRAQQQQQQKQQQQRLEREQQQQRLEREQQQVAQPSHHPQPRPPANGSSSGSGAGARVPPPRSSANSTLSTLAAATASSIDLAVSATASSSTRSFRPRSSDPGALRPPPPSAPLLHVRQCTAAVGATAAEPAGWVLSGAGSLPRREFWESRGSAGTSTSGLLLPPLRPLHAVRVTLDTADTSSGVVSVLPLLDSIHGGRMDIGTGMWSAQPLVMTPQPVAPSQQAAAVALAAGAAVRVSVLAASSRRAMAAAAKAPTGAPPPSRPWRPHDPPLGLRTAEADRQQPAPHVGLELCRIDARGCDSAEDAADDGGREMHRHQQG